MEDPISILALTRSLSFYPPPFAPSQVSDADENIAELPAAIENIAELPALCDRKETESLRDQRKSSRSVSFETTGSKRRHLQPSVISAVRRHLNLGTKYPQRRS